jgi:hypothetical protein
VEGGQKERRKRGVYKAQPKYMKAAAERAFWVCSYIGREEGSLFFFLFLFTPPPSFSIHETRYKGEERWEEYSIPSPKETNGRKKKTHIFSVYSYLCVCVEYEHKRKKKKFREFTTPSIRRSPIRIFDRFRPPCAKRYDVPARRRPPLLCAETTIVCSWKLRLATFCSRV